jgi:hypothetical protein
VVLVRQRRLAQAVVQELQFMVCRIEIFVDEAQYVDVLELLSHYRGVQIVRSENGWDQLRTSNVLPFKKPTRSPLS